jgi:hypothetical protein
MGSDGQLYEWVQGVDGLGQPAGVWQAVAGADGGDGIGELAQDADGQLYEWVQGVDGLGNPIGFWKKALKSLLRKALPIARQVAPFIPGGAAALTAATPILQHAGFLGYGGLGALYEAPDGTVYQMQGIDADEELDGFADDELQGFAADDELDGFADDELDGFADDELQGFSEDELSDDGEVLGFADDGDLLSADDSDELEGFADDDMSGVDADDLEGIAADEDLDGVEGYVRERGVHGIDAFVPDAPRQTPWFKAPAKPPTMWSPLW